MRFVEPYFISKDERGDFKGISRNLKLEEINIINTNANQVRGNHFHTKTKELFYLINGTIRLTVKTLSGEIVYDDTVEAGKIFVIDENLLHTIYSITDTTWINALTKKMDQNNPDICNYNSLSEDR